MFVLTGFVLILTWPFSLLQSVGEEPLTPNLIPACGTVAPPEYNAKSVGNCSSSSTTTLFIYEPPRKKYLIPIVVHILEHNNGSGKISDSQVQSQIDVLNEDFLAIPGSHGALGNDAQIEFSLAGTTRSVDDDWYNDAANSSGVWYFDALSWDIKKYVNVYTNAAGGLLGYSYLPQTTVPGPKWSLIVCNWLAFGKNAPWGSPYDQGRTLTHEMGHYFGLYHTFVGCFQGLDCHSFGDLICDTNDQNFPVFGCPASVLSCGLPVPTQNHMNYGDDLCKTQFTPEQVNRMRCTLETYRPELFTIVPCGSEYSVCPTTANSVGAGAVLATNGEFSVSMNQLTLSVCGAPPENFGVFFLGDSQISVPFGEGTRCVGGNVHRLGVIATDANGIASQTVNLNLLPAPFQIVPGSSWYFQFWYRDPAGGPAGTNLSNALKLTFCD